MDKNPIVLSLYDLSRVIASGELEPERDYIGINKKNLKLCCHFTAHAVQDLKPGGVFYLYTQEKETK